MATVMTPNEDKEARYTRTAAPIGDLLQRTGVLSEQDVRRVVTLQRERGLRFGEAAVQMGLISEQDISRALSKQFDYPYVNSDESNLHRPLYAAYEPFDAAAELMRGLRSTLCLRWFTEKNKILTIVGSRSGEGCSNLAANLAISFAQLGERTLLIDADLRAPTQHKLFGLETDKGLTSLLGGRSSVQDSLLQVELFPQLSVLCAGNGVPNPQELLGRLTFTYLMETLPSGFDVVIVDTPPILDYADAQMVAARTGGALLVGRRGRTRIADIAKSKQQLQVPGSTLLGMVINEA